MTSRPQHGLPSVQAPDWPVSRTTENDMLIVFDNDKTANPTSSEPDVVASPLKEEIATPTAETKASLILNHLRQKDGITLSEIAAATGWQAHSVRGFLSGTVRKKLGLNLISEIVVDGIRRYRIVNAGATEPIELPPFGPFKGVAAAEQLATRPEV